ncbi:hypothetical protein BX661DRAFT_177977 [Kickxella alabastrina]|uniref:uncharacterized protein n=1 Tax=Kickxella alabastrina TaxID=61397 RepID=UPI0022203A41|nr:uncharacterized protein BX661DRAFT_177977 [Kickxella alabastrina]KAI7833236.1 hypothetical protein BX661DRAFT_177977 [Kickxella alabastrina]
MLDLEYQHIRSGDATIPTTRGFKFNQFCLLFPQHFIFLAQPSSFIQLPNKQALFFNISAMQTTIAFVACVAASVAAQGTMGSMVNPDMSMMNPSPFSSLANANAHLSRMASFFDMSHVSNVETTSPVMVTHVFDPATNKFTHLALNVVQTSNGAYYLPVCTVDSITTAGPDQVAATDGCQYGVQMSSVPANVVRTKLGVVRHLFQAIRSAASHPTFNFGGFMMNTGAVGHQSGAGAGMIPASTGATA